MVYNTFKVTISILQKLEIKYTNIEDRNMAYSINDETKTIAAGAFALKL